MLLISFAFNQQYHILRTASVAGYEVHVLGKNSSRWIKYSRFCASYREMIYDPRCDFLEKLVHEIQYICSLLAIDVILPSDIISTKLLILINKKITYRCAPVPDLETFTILNDKWRFYHLCKLSNISTPDTYLFEERAEFLAALKEKRLDFPLIVKPINRMSSSGILKLDSEYHFNQINLIDYDDILVQKYIDGKDCGLNLLCREGKLLAYSFQRQYNWGYEFTRSDEILDLATEIAQKTKLNGVANFDIREEFNTGNLFFIECNPRFWYSTYVSMLAGLNFVDLCLEDLCDATGQVVTINEKTNVILNKSFLKHYLSNANKSEVDRLVLNYYVNDPIPILLERLRIVDDTNSEMPGSVSSQITTLESINLS